MRMSWRLKEPSSFWLFTFGVFLWGFVPEFVNADEKTPGVEEMTYKSKVFRLFVDARNWADSREACQELGGDLASFHSTAVIEKLKPLVSPNFGKRPRIWIGLKRNSDIEDSFDWVDLSGGDFRNWKSNQPDGFNRDEECVELLGFNISGGWGLWNDANCNEERPFVCKFSKSKAASAETETISSANTKSHCDGENSEWFLNGDSCYLVDDEPRPWLLSRAICNEKGGDLVSVGSLYEDNFLVNLVTAANQEVDYWIGMNSLADRSLTWSDGRPVTYVNWYPDQPKDTGTVGCVGISSDEALWFNTYCDNALGFICMKPYSSEETPPSTTPSKNTGDCPQDFFSVGYSDKCFHLSTQRENYRSATIKCGELDTSSEIASVNSALDQDVATMLLHRLGNDTDVWIGLHDGAIVQSYEWEGDMVEVNFTNWAQLQPKDKDKGTGKERCVEMIGRVKDVRSQETAKWQVEYCKAQNVYLCQTPKGSTSSLNDELTAPAGQELGFSLNIETKSWDDAASYCKSQGGELASVTDVGDLAVFDFYVRTKDVSTPVWTGMYFEETENRFVWSDKSFLGKDFWANGQPSMYLSDQRRCVAHVNGRWEDGPCDQAYPFMCQKRTEPVSKPAVGTEFNCTFYNDTEAWGDSCYYSQPDEQVHFYDAAKACMDRGMQLVSLHSKEEVDFVTDLAMRSKEGQTADVQIWIGLEGDLKGGFRWHDRSPMDFEQWSSSFEYNGTTVECIEMVQSTNQWSTVTCNATRGYTCKGPKLSGSQEESKTDEEALPDVTGEEGDVPDAEDEEDYDEDDDLYDGNVDPDLFEEEDTEEDYIEDEDDTFWEDELRHEDHFGRRKKHKKKESSSEGEEDDELTDDTSDVDDEGKDPSSDGGEDVKPTDDTSDVDDEGKASSSDGEEDDKPTDDTSDVEGKDPSSDGGEDVKPTDDTSDVDDKEKDSSSNGEEDDKPTGDNSDAYPHQKPVEQVIKPKPKPTTAPNTIPRKNSSKPGSGGASSASSGRGQSEGLSGGVIAGIVVVVIVLCAFGVAGFFLFRRRSGPIDESAIQFKDFNEEKTIYS